MIVTFCGHSSFKKTIEFEKKLLEYMEKIIGDKKAEMYLGNYGAFDSFAYDCCKKYQESHAKVSLIFVTPYLDNSNLELQRMRYNSIIYPEIERVPPKFAISHRNRYMIDKCDFVISYITHSFGGAYQTYKYAKRKNKVIFNLSDFA